MSAPKHARDRGSGVRRPQLHLGVLAQLTGPGYQPEQFTADVLVGSACHATVGV
jgi:hypothetical protein